MTRMRQEEPEVEVWEEIDLAACVVHSTVQNGKGAATVTQTAGVQ